MNPVNALRRAYARLYSAELSAAAWLDTRRIGRLAPLAWVHQGIRPWVPAVFATIAITASHPSRNDTAIIVAAALAAVAFSRIAVKSHYILNEEDRPCPYCPTRDDGDGRGGIWLDLDDDGPTPIPAAPGPIADYSDEQIAAMAGDIDADYADVCRNAAKETQR